MYRLPATADAHRSNPVRSAAATIRPTATAAISGHCASWNAGGNTRRSASQSASGYKSHAGGRGPILPSSAEYSHIAIATASATLAATAGVPTQSAANRTASKTAPDMIRSNRFIPRARRGRRR